MKWYLSRLVHLSLTVNVILFKTTLVQLTTLKAAKSIPIQISNYLFTSYLPNSIVYYSPLFCRPFPTLRLFRNRVVRIHRKHVPEEAVDFAKSARVGGWSGPQSGHPRHKKTAGGARGYSSVVWLQQVHPHRVQNYRTAGGPSGRSAARQ